MVEAVASLPLPARFVGVGIAQGRPHISGMDNEALDRAIRATLRRLHEAPEWSGRLQAICERMALRDQAMLRSLRRMGT
jgi:hypothetical protein